jgi:hypothetical protein
MNRDDIIRMAREAGIAGVTVYSEEESSDILSPDIELFAELIAKHILAKSYPELVSLAAKHAAETVAAAEREACAVIAFNAKTYLEAAAAIRARGKG